MWQVRPSECGMIRRLLRRVRTVRVCLTTVSLLVVSSSDCVPWLLLDSVCVWWVIVVRGVMSVGRGR